MKTIILLISLMAAFNSIAAVTVVHTSLEARAIKGKDKQTRVRIALCENGRCTSLVKSTGYTAQEWNRIGRMCRRSQTFAPLGNILKVAGEISGVAIPGHPGMVVGFILGSFGTSREEMIAIKASNAKLSHILNVRANTSLSVTQFYHLIEGVKTCAGKLEDHYRHIEMGKRVMNK